jgi:hypothetical protein
VDWNHWRKELEQRRRELHVELKRGLKTKTGDKPQRGDTAEIDALIDKSWDETLAFIGGERKAGIDEEKLKNFLDQYLLTKSPGGREKIEELEEEIEELVVDEPEESGESDEIEELAVDKQEKLENLEEIEALEAPEAMEEIIELAEPEELEEPDETENLEIAKPKKLEEPEEMEELEELGEPEKIDNIENQKETAELIPEEDLDELLAFDEDAPEQPSDQGSATEGLMTSEAKQLNMYFVKPLLSVPFSTALNTEVEVLAVQDVDDDAIPELSSEEANTVIAKRNGVPYINESILNPDKETTKKLDGNFKRLVESVLSKD